MRWIMRLAAIVVAAVMSACGGSGDDANGAANPPTSAQTTITLQSDTGDYIGQGRSYSYTRADASITVLAERNWNVRHWRNARRIGRSP